jgi:hypothetical protein
MWKSVACRWQIFLWAGIATAPLIAGSLDQRGDRSARVALYASVGEELIPFSVDVERAALTPAAEAPLASAGQALRDRKGELILVSTATAVADRISRYDVAHRPALAANVDQALMILKLLRPSTQIRRPRRHITSLTLPAIEPPATA